MSDSFTAKDKAPVFKLEGIIKVKDETEDFEGPLALILLLLSKDKIEIRDISISLILQQYLSYLDEAAQLNLDIASEFVAMASHLAYIKTKVLLSGDQEVSELEELMTSLEELQRGDIYLQIRTAAEVLSGMYARGGAMMEGPPEYFPADTQYGYIHCGGDLLEAVLRVIGRENIKIDSINPRRPVFPGRIIYPISEKTTEILEKLRRKGNISVNALFYESRSRAELVAALIAILELCKLGSIFLMGEEDNMTISFRTDRVENLPELTAESG